MHEASGDSSSALYDENTCEPRDPNMVGAERSYGKRVFEWRKVYENVLRADAEKMKDGKCLKTRMG